MNKETFPSPTIRATIRLAHALNLCGEDEMRNALRWLNEKRKDPRICYCERDTFTHVAKLLRKDLKGYGPR